MNGCSKRIGSPEPRCIGARSVMLPDTKGDAGGTASCSPRAERSLPLEESPVDSYGQCNIRGFGGCDAEWISAFEKCALEVVRPGMPGCPGMAGGAGHGRVDD